MSQYHEQELEQRISDELNSLPNLSAPAELRGRVMAAIAARSVAGVRAGARLWPLWARVMAGAMAAGLVVVAWWFLYERGMDPVGQMSSLISEIWALGSLVVGVLEVLLKALAVAIKQAGTFLPVVLACVALLSYLSCIGVGTLWYRMSRANVLGQWK